MEEGSTRAQRSGPRRRSVGCWAGRRERMVVGVVRNDSLGARGGAAADDGQAVKRLKAVIAASEDSPASEDGGEEGRARDALIVLASAKEPQGPSGGEAKEAFARLKERFERASQEHLFDHLATLTDTQAASLADQLRSINIERTIADFKGALARSKGASTCAPAPLHPADIVTPTAASRARHWAAGLAAIAGGRVAVVTLAGGQGTRLGSSAPKGCYDIGLASGRSLFELQALRLRRIAGLAAAAARKTGSSAAPSAASSLPWYIMTSAATHEATVDFFRANDHFGVDASSITFFQQGQLPALSPEGKLLLTSPDALVLSPDGNGGIYEAMEREGILADLTAKGIEHVHMYCVDNALVRIADPHFVGAAIESGSDCMAKSIVKTEPTESVGVFCRRPTADGEEHHHRLGVAEYSELDAATAAARTADGSLLHGQANIANHCFTLAFLKTLSSGDRAKESLPIHLAYKKIPHLVPGTATVETAMGYKMEKFIFDVFALARKPLLYQCERNEEFAPLKNAPGSSCDGPEQCKAKLLALHAKWPSNRRAIDGEVSPLDSYCGEEL